MDKEDIREQKINIKDLMLYIILRWRIILFFSLIIAILLGGWRLISYQTLNNEKREEAEAQFQYESDSYYAQRDTIILQINNIKENKEKQVEYNNNSIKMNIDPLNVAIGTVGFYVDTDYKIMPGTFYQNIDKTSRVLNGYSMYIFNGTMYQQLLNKLSYKTELAYLKEIVTPTIDMESGMISITVNHVDAERCKELLDLIKELLIAKQKELSNSIGTHELVKVDEAYYSAINLELEEYQKTNVQSIAEMIASIQVNDEQLKKMSAPEYKYTKSNILKQSIKLSIIGLLSGMIITIMLMVIKYFMSDKVENVSEFRQRADISVLGTFDQDRKSKIDQWIIRKSSSTQSMLLQQKKAEIIYETIKLKVEQVVSLRTDKHDCSVLLVSNYNSKVYDGISQELKKISSGKEIQIAIGKSITNDVETIKQLANSDFIVLVEHCGMSRYEEIYADIQMISNLNKPVLGAIVINS